MSSLTVPGFDILETLRQTSKTITLKAVQHSLDRTVALTFLRPELAGNPDEVQGFLGVARVCSHLKVAGLPQIYDIVSNEAHHYLVMEHVEGPSVTDLVGQRGVLSVMQAVRIAQTIAEALDCAWTQSRLVYSNLKPSEIRIDANGTPKLTDFGRAMLMPAPGEVAKDTTPGLIVGTPNFLAPEQARGDHQIDCRTDMYALGATLYYTVTGRVPFPDSDPETVIRHQIEEQIPHPRLFRPELPVNLCGLISRLMMKLPDDRYANWQEVLGDMQHVLRGKPLRRRETPFAGISTIASTPSESPTAARPRVRLPQAEPPAPAAVPLLRPRRRSGPPEFIRFVLWLLLGVWLALLANDRLGNRLNLPLPSPLLPIDDIMHFIFGTNSGAPAPVAPPVALPSEPRPPARPSSVATVIPPVVPPPARISATSVTPSSPARPQTLPEPVVRRIADALARGDRHEAALPLNDNLDMDPAKLVEYRTAVRAIPDLLRLAEETVMKSRGKEIAISYKGKERRIIPRTVVDGEINADFVAGGENRPVTFKTAGFMPDELAALMPENPDSPSVQAAVCLAYLRAGRRDEVAKRLSGCGILAPIIEAAAQP